MAKPTFEKAASVRTLANTASVKTAIAKRLDEIAGQYGDKRRDGKVASCRTQDANREVLGTAFNLLHAKGFRLHEPENLGDRHMKLLVRTWYESGLAPKTIKNYLSRMNQVYTAMGKRGLIKKLEYYLPEVDPKLLDVKSNAKKAKAGRRLESTCLRRLRKPTHWMNDLA